MLTLRCVNRTRYLLSPHHDSLICCFFSTTTTTATSTLMKPPSAQPLAASMRANDVLLHFKDWFTAAKNSLFDQIFEILNTQDSEKERLALSKLNLRVTETLVLDVLKYGNGKNVLACLKFFDWAGRQKGFYHTRATHYAIFKILSKAKLMSVMLDFLNSFMTRVPGGSPRVKFYSTLVMGYAVAGKPEIALQLFGKMRFQGIDLDAFAYHVLLNALVEERLFDVADMIAKQIKISGHESEVTHSILVKSFCKQNNLDQAEAYVNGLVESGVKLGRFSLSVLVDALCKNRQFEKADSLIKKIGESGSFSMQHVYGTWIKDLVRAGNVDGALEFLKTKRLHEGYLPDVFRYNTLVCRMLRENRLEEVFDLLSEMQEDNIKPDEVTMSSVLCFLCKVGLMENALDLYNSRAEFGLSPNKMGYDHLITTLCREGRVEEAYSVVRDSPKHGYFPQLKTFNILSAALCREGKIDKMKDLLFAASQRGIKPSVSAYDKLITAICKANSVDDMCFIENERAQLDKSLSKSSFTNLILGFSSANRGDIAAKLLIEFQEKGYKPIKSLFRAVISSFWNLGNPEIRFKMFFSMQLSLHKDGSKTGIYNNFIDAAGYAGKPELSRKVYDIMKSNGVEPSKTTDVLLLRSFIKNKKINDACQFFGDLGETNRIRKKICNTMLVGLCKANRVSYALLQFKNIRRKGINLSLECYEELVKCMCQNKQYEDVIYIVKDMMRARRSVSSFMGNILLETSFKNRNLYNTWIELAKQGDNNDEGIVSRKNDKLCELLGGFCFYIQTNRDIIDLEETIEQCFPLDVYTYNFLMTIFCNQGLLDDAVRVFRRIREKGFEENNLSFEILLDGFQRYGRIEEAKEISQEMLRRGFDKEVRQGMFRQGLIGV